jgi:hypothetical protein
MRVVEDPFAILGVDPGVSERELAAAYHGLALRFHPDRNGGAGGQQRMAELNAAYAAARRTLRSDARGRRADTVVRRRPAPGAWLPDGTRRSLGWELLTALGEGERVEVIAEAGGAGRGAVRLAVTDRRLLWLLEDAVTARVDWVRFGLIARVEHRPPRRGRGATVALRTKTGRRFVFGDLQPEVAEAIAARLAPG